MMQEQLTRSAVAAERFVHLHGPHTLRKWAADGENPPVPPCMPTTLIRSQRKRQRPPPSIYTRANVYFEFQRSIPVQTQKIFLTYYSATHGDRSHGF